MYMPVDSGSLKDVAINNFYYYTQESISYFGPSATLALLGAALVVMTGLKTGATYLSSHIILCRCGPGLCVIYVTLCMTRW